MKAKRGKRVPDYKVGDLVEIPDVKGLTFAGHPMQQDPRNVGKRGKIIAIEDISGAPCPLIRLTGGRIIHGYECWWKPIERSERPVPTQGGGG